jgi:phosphoglycerate kinase
VSDLPLLADLPVEGRKVLLRLDLNAPVDLDGVITDETRIDRVLPTLRALSERGARTIIVSHFGRPKGSRDDTLSLTFLQTPLSQALGIDVAVAPDCIGPAAEAVADAIAPGGFALLENLRFHPGEEANDPAFVEALARNGDVYVNDAFSVSHRAHASVVGLPGVMPHAIGLSMQAELDALDSAIGNPRRPVLAIVGGAKVSTKLALIGNLIDRVDALAIGGAMANTFLAAQGHPVGRSLHEPDMLDTARQIMTDSQTSACDLILPTDAVVAASLEAGIATETVGVNAIPTEKMILDIGPASADAIGDRIPASKTVLWNGPVGAFEFAPFDAATTALAQATANATQNGTTISVAGGGDTVAALVHADAADDFTYVSTAGGAFLEWLEGKTLPGVAAQQA